jgi:hypothetical protein
MSNQKKKQQVTAEVIERLDNILNELNELYGTETHWDRIMELSNEQNQIEEQYDLMDTVYEVNGKKGIKDIKGKVRVPALYNDFAVLYAYTSFRNTPVIALNDEGKFAIVKANGTGEAICRFEYEDIDIEPLSKLFVVRKAGKTALMNSQGQLLTPLELDKVYLYMPINVLIEIEMDDKMGLYDYCNKLYVRPVYDAIDEKEGSVYVQLGERWGYISSEDGTFIDEYDEDTLDEAPVLHWMD